MTDDVRLAMIDAAKLLGRKDYGKIEMYSLLVSRHPERATEAAVDLLESVGLVGNGRGASPRKALGYVNLKANLRAKGVDQNLIEMLLESDLLTDLEKANDLVRTNLPGEKDKEKIARFLSFRGIDSAVVEAVAARIK